jgi:hypothetical protein
MPFISLHIRRNDLKKFLILPAAALALAVLYVISLHPDTGFLGGAFFFIIGWWLIPSAVNLLLAVWITSFFKVHWGVRSIIFIATSFLLGMNTLLPALLRPRPRVVSSGQVFRVVEIKPSEPVDAGLMSARLPNEVFYTSAPSALGVQVGADEGCMCMWWTPPLGPSSEEQVWNVINAYIHRTDIGGPDYIGMGKTAKMALGRIHFDARFTRSATPNTVNLLLTIYDGWDVTAIYRQLAIPVWSTQPPRPTRPGLASHFYRNAMSMLVRENFWVFLLDRRLSGFQPAPLRAFLHRAVRVE